MRGAEDPKRFTVRASNGALCDPNEAIFPIFRTDKNGKLHLLGTGFFITRFGWFVTAKHVLESVISEQATTADGLAIVQFLEGNIFHIRPVEAFIAHELADVGVGICAAMSHKVTGEPLYNKILTLNTNGPKMSETVWTYAYPGTKVSGLNPQEITINPLYYVGSITDYFSKGRDRVMLPFPCYQTSIVLHGASSGGPVFGSKGTVIGVNSTGYEVEEGECNISFVSRISDIMQLTVRDVLRSNEPEPQNVSIRDLVATNDVRVVQ